MRTKRKKHEKGITYLYLSTKGSPQAQQLFTGRTRTRIVHGTDPDTIFRSRGGPGYDLHIVHGADPDKIFSVPGKDPDTGFLPFAGRPGDGLPCGSHPASSVHGPDPDTGFCAGRIHTQASLRVELAKMKLLQMFDVPRVGYRHAILGLQPDYPVRAFPLR